MVNKWYISKIIMIRNFDSVYNPDNGILGISKYSSFKYTEMSEILNQE